MRPPILPLTLVACVALAAPAAPAALVAQATVAGRVTTEAGTPLAAVTIFVPQADVGAQTGDDGRYSLSIPAGRARGPSVTVTARRIGYASQSATVALRDGAAA